MLISIWRHDTEFWDKGQIGFGRSHGGFPKLILSRYAAWPVAAQ
jgi:hypothetical protein